MSRAEPFVQLGIGVPLHSTAMDVVKSLPVRPYAKIKPLLNLRHSPVLVRTPTKELLIVPAAGRTIAALARIVAVRGRYFSQSSLNKSKYQREC